MATRPEDSLMKKLMHGSDAESAASEAELLSLGEDGLAIILRYADSTA